MEVVSQLLAVQAQDARAGALALRARGSGFGASDVASSRELVCGWLLRGTLHLVAVEDWWWLHGLVARPKGAQGDARVLSILAEEGPLERRPLAQRLASKGLALEGQAFPHLLAGCCARGEVVLTPAREYVLAADWVGERPPAFDRAAALRELGVRYRRGHACGTPEDLAAWSGLGIRDARAALEGVGALRSAQENVMRPRLLPAFDPYLLGWKDRSFAVPASLARRVHPGGGMLRAVTLDEGVVTGTWTLPRGVPTLDAPDPDRYADEIGDVQRFEAA